MFKAKVTHPEPARIPLRVAFIKEATDKTIGQMSVVVGTRQGGDRGASKPTLMGRMKKKGLFDEEKGTSDSDGARHSMRGKSAGIAGLRTRRFELGSKKGTTRVHVEGWKGDRRRRASGLSFLDWLRGDEND